MQYNNTITLIHNALTDFGEPVEETRADLRCCVLYQRNKAVSDPKGTGKAYDLKFIVGNKSFAPYSSIVSDALATFEFEATQYNTAGINAIKDFSGKTKYLEVELTEIKDGS